MNDCIKENIEKLEYKHLPTESIVDYVVHECESFIKSMSETSYEVSVCEVAKTDKTSVRYIKKQLPSTYKSKLYKEIWEIAKISTLAKAIKYQSMQKE